MTTIFERVRQSTRHVADEAQDVHIDDERIETYADELAKATIDPPSRDPDLHYLGHGAETLAYTLILDAINFGSGYFPKTQPVDGRTGYHATALCLTDYFETHGPLTPGDLVDLTPEQCAELFQQEFQQRERRKLMTSFAHVLNQFGAHVRDEYDGLYTELVEAAGHSADRLVRLLAEMPTFDDTALYHNEEVAFYKRAQITAADLHIAFDGEEWGHFQDLDELTLFAGNLVPHVLRLDGVLTYSDLLAKRVDRPQRLEPASPEELEIRACAVQAVERLVDALQSRGLEVTPMELDNYLWNRGQHTRYQVRSSPHLTQTVYY